MRSVLQRAGIEFTLTKVGVVKLFDFDERRGKIAMSSGIYPKEAGQLWVRSTVQQLPGSNRHRGAESVELSAMTFRFSQKKGGAEAPPYKAVTLIQRARLRRCRSNVRVLLP